MRPITCAALLLVSGLGASCSSPSESGGSGGSTSAQTPIRDPSFEGAQPNPPGTAQGSPWNLVSGCTGQFDVIYPSFATSTGFMPTSGTQYALFDDQGLCQPPGKNTFSIDQYNDDFGQSHTLTFDYEMIATIQPGCEGASAEAQILFTGNGTQSLWKSQSFTQNGDTQQRDQSVSVSGLPPLGECPTGACNKLTIQMTSTGGCLKTDGSLNICPCATFELGIDNLRLQ